MQVAKEHLNDNKDSPKEGLHQHMIQKHLKNDLIDLATVIIAHSNWAHNFVTVKILY